MKRKSVLAFDATIDAGGKIVVPSEIAAALGPSISSVLHVQLTPAAFSDELSRHGVTDGEVEQIAEIQMESREQVITFLLAEGALAGPRDGTGRKKGRRR